MITVIKKISGLMPAAILISIVLSGCSRSPEPNVAKNDNTNQSSKAANNTNQTPAAANSNNTNANMPNVSMPVANKKPASSPAVQQPTPQIGSGATDFSLLTEARSKLSSDQELINAVIIEIKEGNVTLTGNVSSEAQKTKAAQIVQSVKGVKSVKNNLRVAS